MVKAKKCNDLLSKVITQRPLFNFSTGMSPLAGKKFALQCDEYKRARAISSLGEGQLAPLFHKWNAQNEAITIIKEYSHAMFSPKVYALKKIVPAKISENLTVPPSPVISLRPPLAFSEALLGQRCNKNFLDIKILSA